MDKDERIRRMVHDVMLASTAYAQATVTRDVLDSAPNFLQEDIKRRLCRQLVDAIAPHLAMTRQENHDAQAVDFRVTLTNLSHIDLRVLCEKAYAMGMADATIKRVSQ